MRRKIAAGNWKMNLTADQASDLVSGIIDKSIPNDVWVIFASPFPYLQDLCQRVLDQKNIRIAAQNCHHLKSGAYTGEVSVDMLQSIGVDCVIVGHSERRTLNGESDEMIKQKVDLLLEAGMEPIFCCGEPLEVREANGQQGFVGQQLVHSLFHLTPEDISNVTIAYEPIWAIGTGRTASPEQAQEMHHYIRSMIREKYGETVSKEISILYGGSVNAKNASDLFSNQDVDGGLVGGASLDAISFNQIINAF